MSTVQQNSSGRGPELYEEAPVMIRLPQGGIEE